MALASRGKACFPAPDRDLSSHYAAGITAHTIIPAGLADNFDLDITIWAYFANARLARERSRVRQQQPAA